MVRRLHEDESAHQCGLPKQTETAIAFGATGIGLCRTEHMFFEGDRIDFVREMILSTKKSDRVAAVSKLLPYQKGDFKGIFKAPRACRAPSACWTRPARIPSPDEGTAA